MIHVVIPRCKAHRGWVRKISSGPGVAIHAKGNRGSTCIAVKYAAMSELDWIIQRNCPGRRKDLMKPEVWPRPLQITRRTPPAKEEDRPNSRGHWSSVANPRRRISRPEEDRIDNAPSSAPNATVSTSGFASSCLETAQRSGIDVAIDDKTVVQTEKSPVTTFAEKSGRRNSMAANTFEVP